MYIKRIEIEGFKSYAQRQVIDNFDKEFNAITGLNGSGKSNILDSICFVLGITNLSQIRANNLSDLVYKQGQAGITKATVTITFDNRARNGVRHSPVGCEDKDEIVIRRQIVLSNTSAKTSSYYLNGASQNSSRIIDLFRSVGMNVNNPHFLIMQGRITKVLNMKPAEILGMVEEAAGTKMYDAKRQHALGMIEKKEKRVEDIKRLMETDILPIVLRMKQDREQLLKYQKLDREIGFHRRKLSAFVYQHALEKAEDCNGMADEKVEQMRKLEEKVKENDDLLEEMGTDMEERERKKGEEKKNVKTAVEAELATARGEYGDAESAMEDCKQKLEDLKAESRRVSDEKKNDEAQLIEKKEELAAKQADVGDEENAGIELEEAVKKARARMEALEQGMTTDDKGQMVTLESQMTDARTRLAHLTAEIKRREVRRKELKKKRAEKAAEVEKYEKANEVEAAWKKKKTDALKRIEAELEQLDFDDRIFMEKIEKLQNLKKDEMTIAQKVAEMERQNICRFEAQYRDPYAGFDRSQVMGSIVRLFRMKDPKDAMALEPIVVGQANALVVKTESTAKDMFKNNVFTKRTRVYPLDAMEVTSNERWKQKIAAAKAAAPGENVECALNLISFNNAVTGVMRQIFQDVMICDNPKTAHKLAYGEHRMRTITRNGGSDYRPGGTVTGGSRPNNSHSFDLVAIDKWFCATDQLIAKRKEVAECQAECDAMNENKERFEALNTDHANLRSELEAHAEKMKFSEGQTCQQDLEEIDKEIPEHDAYLAQTAGEVKELQDKVAQFEQRKKSDKAYQEKEKADAKKKLKELEQKQKNLKGAFEKARKTLSVLRSEIDSLEKAITDAANSITELTADITRAEQENAQAEAKCGTAKGVLAAAQKKLDDLHLAMREKENEIGKLASKMEKTRKEQQQTKANIEALGRDRERCLTEAKGWKDKAKEERKRNTWIDDEKEHFGQKGTDYDFEGYSYAEGKKTIEEMEDEMKKVDGKVNTASVDLLAPSEERVMALQQKQAQLETDKAKLISTISVLDVKKKEEIKKAYESVTKDFGNIFSTLLPGTSAKLEPPIGKTIYDGLEIKVAFNGKWKESLGELSGGQRSLVALSLVLAMLKFRPAPIYILDEVDAALDLSHTQNIGAMIKKHFTTSQFVVVSLKEGMFNHANVLFKTRFVDGTSQVSRIENSSS